MIITLLNNKNVLSLLTNVSLAAFGLLSFLLLTRSLDKELFGAWVLYTVASGLIEMMRFGLTKVAIIKFLAGADVVQRKIILGSNWIIGIVITVILATLIVFTNFVFSSYINETGYRFFFVWYPFLLFFNLPFNNALSILEADQKFGSILFLRLVTGTAFSIFLLLNLYYYRLNLDIIIVVHFLIHFLVSAYCIVLQLDGIQFVRKSSRATIKKFLNFGKFTLGSLVGSSLLKSADVIIIGLSSMGASAVALYSIPLKLIEIMMIPLRSFSSTAYPKLAKASSEGRNDEVIKLFYLYSGVTTLLFIPVSMLCFFFSKYFVLLLGGEQYLASIEPIIIFKVFAIYGLLLPIDRFTGIVLDAINRPKINFNKVMVMAVTNILGDIIAIFIFKSLIMVAVVTVIFTIAGQFLGWFYVSRYLAIRPKEMYYESKEYCYTWMKVHFSKNTKS